MKNLGSCKQTDIGILLQMDNASKVLWIERNGEWKADYGMEAKYLFFGNRITLLKVAISNLPVSCLSFTFLFQLLREFNRNKKKKKKIYGKGWRRKPCITRFLRRMCANPAGMGLRYQILKEDEWRSSWKVVVVSRG